MEPYSDYLVSRGATQRASRDHQAFDVPQASFEKSCEELKTTFGFDLLADLTAVDWGVEAPQRFSTVYHLFSSQHYQYLRLVVPCSEALNPSMPSVSHIWPAADWHEREAYDMFGITFTGHPNLKRILMWDGYPYYPLRKDFPLGGIETALPAADVEAATGTRAERACTVGGPFVSTAGLGPTTSSREPSSRS